jgi:hypothetical protein
MKKRVFFRPINTNFVVKELIQIEVLNTKIVLILKKIKNKKWKKNLQLKQILYYRKP